MPSKSSSVLKELQSSLKSFVATRKSIYKLVEQIANKRNQLSYISSEQLDSIFGSSVVSASTFSMAMNEELYEMKESVGTARTELQAIVTTIQELIAGLMRAPSLLEDLPIEPHFLIELVGQIQQQVVIEILAAKKVTDFEDVSIDQDLLVTAMATFKYSPYLRQSDLDLLIELTVK